MPTITANRTTPVTLAAGYVLHGDGPGTAVIASGPNAGFWSLQAGDDWEIGPFAAAVTVEITATQAAITYNVVDGAAGQLTRAEAASVQALVSGARNLVTVGTAWDAATAAANTAAIQSALDAAALFPGGGTVRVSSNGQPFPISSTLLIDSNTTLDMMGSEPKAYGTVTNLLTTRAYQQAGATVTVTWTSGLTASVAWTGHGQTVDDFVWLNRADQPQFCGVFSVASVTDANTIVINLRRQPTTGATGTIIARPAHKHVEVRGGVWNYNATGAVPTNIGVGSAANAIILAGVQDLKVRDIRGKDTLKYLVAVGAVSQYEIDGAGGDVLASDCAKVYGPAFSGRVTNLFGSCNDDMFSAQTREPSAFATQDFCHGDILGLEVARIGGKTTTSAAVLYSSPFGLIDDVHISNVTAVTGSGLIRLETIYTTGTSEIGTVRLSDIGTVGQSSAVILNSSTATQLIRNLVIDNPKMRSTAATGRLLAISGTQVQANVLVRGGYVENVDALVNNSSTLPVSVVCEGLTVGSCYQGFRHGATTGTLFVTVEKCRFNNNFGLAFLNNNAGTPAITLRGRDNTFAADPTVTLTGTPTFAVFAPDIRLDVGAAGFSKTIVNQRCINTSAGGARGTLVAGQPVICNGTNWLQATALGNTF